MAAAGLNRGIGESPITEAQALEAVKFLLELGVEAEGATTNGENALFGAGLSRLEHAARAADRQGRRRERRQQGRRHALARRVRASATGSAASSTTRRARRCCSSTARIRSSASPARRRTSAGETADADDAQTLRRVTCRVRWLGGVSASRMSAPALPVRDRRALAIGDASRAPGARQPRVAGRRARRPRASWSPRYCVSLPQRATEDRGPRRSTRRTPTQVANSAGDLGKGRREAAKPRDAAARAAAGPTTPPTTRWPAWLETELDRAAAAHPNPGRPADLHRLNRTEYANAVRDLLGVEIDADGDAAARRAGVRVRHQRRRALDGAGAARSLSDRGREDRAPRRRRPDDPAGVRALHRGQGQLERADVAVADRAARRRLSARARAAGSRRATTFRSTASTSSRFGWTGPMPASSAACNVPNEIEIRVDGVRVGQFTIGGAELSAAAAATSDRRAGIRCSRRRRAAGARPAEGRPPPGGRHRSSRPTASKPEGLGPDRIPIWNREYDVTPAPRSSSRRC